MSALAGSDSRTGLPPPWSNGTRFIHSGELRRVGRRWRGGQQAGEECAESEERGGCEQTACGKGTLHPVGEEGGEKAVKGKTDDNARGRADERDARGDPQDLRARERPGREDAKQYREEPLAAVTFCRELRASNDTSTFHHHIEGR
jgi:hypothetical protein